jgi:hypothetical protein
MTESLPPLPGSPAQHAVVAAQPGSRLEQLAEAYALAKPAADDAKARLETITNAIKLELTIAAPGSNKVDFNAPSLIAPLRLQAKTSWRLDTNRLKTEAPELYAQYAMQTQYWELRAVALRGPK